MDAWPWAMDAWPWGHHASLETWAAVAEAVGLQLAAFIERVPGASLPLDYEHLKRQRLILEVARSGGWTGTAEQILESDWTRPRSIDVVLRRGNETAVVEVWDWLNDVGAAFRGFDAKLASAAHTAEGHVSGVMVLRGTRRNRELVREFGTLFRSHFPAPSATWLNALRSTDPMPTTPGLLWTNVAGTELGIARLASGIMRGDVDDRRRAGARRRAATHC